MREVAAAADVSPDTVIRLERGGPAVTAPERRGFGSQLIERGFGAGAEVSLTFDPAGVVASLRAPLSAFQSGITAR